jgi:hypothetical protein
MERLSKRQRRRTRNIELWMDQGRVEPWNAEEAEALHKRGTPEAAFKPSGSRPAAPLSQVSIAGPSPRGNPTAEGSGAAATAEGSGAAATAEGSGAAE